MPSTFRCADWGTGLVIGHVLGHKGIVTSFKLLIGLCDRRFLCTVLYRKIVVIFPEYEEKKMTSSHFVARKSENAQNQIKEEKLKTSGFFGTFENNVHW